MIGKNLIRLATAALSATIAGAVFAVGESVGNPVQWSTSSTTVTLGADGYCYVRFPVSPSKDCTVWTSGYSTGDALGDNLIGMDVQSASMVNNSSQKMGSGTDDAVVTMLDYPDFYLQSASDGANMYAFCYGETWSYWESQVEGLDQTARGKLVAAGEVTSQGQAIYYIELFGVPGKTVTLNRSDSIKSISSVTSAKSGSPDKPLAVTLTDKEQKITKSYDNGEFNFTLSLKKNEFYYIGVAGSKTANDQILYFTPSNDLEVARYDKWCKGFDYGYMVKPTVGGKYNVCIYSKDGRATTCTLRCMKVGGRPIGEHESEAMSAPIAAGASTQATCTPGFRRTPGSAYADDIIDESLLKVELKKGLCYRITTEGADKPIVLELYNASGKTLVSNRRGFVTSQYDCLVPCRPTADGTYYIGVCRDLPSGTTEITDRKEVKVLVEAREITYPDQWDPEDDAFAGLPAASFLSPVLAGRDDDPVALDPDGHGEHGFGLIDSVDTFAIEARKGIRYKLRASCPDPDRAAVWAPSCTVFTSSDGKTRKEVASGNLLEGISFDAQSYGTHYIEVTISGGTGIDYRYNLHSLACDPEGKLDLGVMNVKLRGAANGTWSLSAEVKKDGKKAPKYASGCDVVVLSGSQEIVFGDVSGLSKPANATVTVPAKGRYEGTFFYSDKVDDRTNDAKNGDGSPTGKRVTALKPAAVKAGGKPQTVSRTLWPDDRADWYSFTVAPKSYYRFRLVPSEELGDAVIEIYSAKSADPAKMVASGTDIEYLSRVTKSATYYLCVRHLGDGFAESAYTLEYSSAQVGALGFAKAAVSVKDSAATVKVQVKRDGGKVGAIRARYETVDGTAQAGSNYVAKTGILVWKDGESSTKDIVIKLIPDLVSTWNEGRTFSVKLSAIPATEREEGELVPAFGTTAATVTVTPAKEKSIGAVRFCGFGCTDEPFASAKKPAAEVGAGDELQLWLERTGGCDGEIAVKVTPTEGKAVAGTDFDATSETLVWKNGDDARKCFTLRTFRPSDAYQASKTMTVKLAVDKTYGDKAVWDKLKKKLGAAVTVTISDPQVSKTMEAYSGSFGKNAGITVKAGKANTWFFDEAGSLRSAPLKAGGSATISLTLTGPGKFAFTPFIDRSGEIGKGDFSCTIGKEKLSAAKNTLSNGEEVVRYLPKGKTTVKFTLTKDKAKTATGDISAGFADYGDGEAFLWKPLPLPKLVAPQAKEITVAEKGCENKDVVKFLWSCSDDPEIVYAFSLDKSKKKLGTADARCSATTNECAHEIEIICDCGESEDGKLLSGQAYFWRVDSMMVDGEGKVRLTNVNTETWSVQAILCGEYPETYVTAGTDATGRPLADVEPVRGAYPVTLVQGVEAKISLAARNISTYDSVSYSLVGGKLPKGVTISGAGKIQGVPTATGESTAVLGVTAKLGKAKVSGGTVAIRFTVEPMDLAAGTFKGLVASEDDRIKGALKLGGMTIGSLKVTAKSDGKIDASIALGGTTYKFSGKKGYASCVPALDNGVPGVTVTLSNLVTITTTSGKTKTKHKNLPNTLTLTACRASSDDWESLNTPMTAVLSLNLLSEDGKSVLENVEWRGEARRDNAKVAQALAGAKEFEGYYTLALRPDAASEVKGRSGYGYLTLTVDAKGAGKVAGVLADGTSVSVSAPVSYLSDTAPGGEPELVMPVYAWVGKTAAFGGWLVLRRTADDDAAYFVSGEGLRWISADKNATYSGTEGFSLVLEPIGGYYDKLYNLQRYYLDCAFMLKGIDDLAGLISKFPEAFGGKTPEIFLGDIPLDWQVNALVAPKDKSLEKFSFTRKTGLFSGSFVLKDVTTDKNGKEKASKIATCTFKGVLPILRDETSSVSFDNAAMMGHYLLPMEIGKRSWSASLPLVVVPQVQED